jgi:xylan 1,4-beta-xylosidase
VDNDTSNSYSAWKRMGAPASPTAAQIAELQQASELAQFGTATTRKTPDGHAVIKMQLPRQAVSLITLSY